MGTSDEATMGYYVSKWLSEPYMLQEETDGMSGMIGTGTMVANMLYFNQVECARYWYTQSNMMTVVEVRYTSNRRSESLSLNLDQKCVCSSVCPSPCK
jgi:hypothetical protein